MEADPLTSKSEGKGCLVTTILMVALVVIAFEFWREACIDLKRDPRRAAEFEIARIKTSLETFRIKYGYLPSDSNNGRLVKLLEDEELLHESRNLNQNGEIIDPWKTVIRISFDSNSKIHIVSAGPDKIFGTADDITNP